MRKHVLLNGSCGATDSDHQFGDLLARADLKQI